MVDDKQSIKSEDTTNELSGELEVLTLHAPVKWRVDGNGVVWVDAESLLNAVWIARADQLLFAENQSKHMAPQASYDVGKYGGIEMVRTAIAMLVNRASDAKRRAQTPTCESASPPSISASEAAKH
jgi:hypothetical protein